MSTFLPDNYTPPASNSHFMKLQDGENNFRIMSSPIMGWTYWDKLNGNKPVRLEYTAENYKIAEESASKNPDPKDQKVKHFWAMIVWNYDTKNIEILEITQKSIQEALRTLSTKKGWGNPVDAYDISVDKSGSGIDTEYQLSPIPPEPTSEEITQEFNKKIIKLRALFYGVDPFNFSWEEPSNEF